MDVVALKRKYAGRLAFNGNIDVTVLATGNQDAIRREVLYKLNAAKGGGFIFQSDHSIAGNVARNDYIYVLSCCVSLENIRCNLENTKTSKEMRKKHEYP